MFLLFLPALPPDSHGYSLGEHTEYAKHQLFRIANRVPMMMRAPWLHQQFDTAGAHTDSHTELLDLYRTVAALAGLEPPGDDTGVAGTDVSALLSKPDMVLKNASYTQYSRCPHTDPRCEGKPAWCHNNCEEIPASEIGVMGYGVITATWHLNEWYSWNGTVCEAVWDAPAVGTELYAVPSATTGSAAFDDENVNVADDPKHAALVTELRGMLWRRFRIPSPGCPSPH